MFSKNKKANESDMILIEDRATADREQRDTYRYVFAPEKRLSMQFKGKTVEIMDISAGGLAFKNRGFSRYDSDQVSLVLEMPNFNGNPCFKAHTRILHITANHFCHCIFEDCSVDEYEIVHKYVLEMQKQDLNSKGSSR